MRVLRNEPRHAAKPEARAEPIDQMRELLALLGPGQSALHRIAALGDQRRKPDHVEAEARIGRVAERGKPVLEQAPYAWRIAQRRAGADLQPVHLAVGAEQRQADEPRALAAPLQHAAELVRQMLDGAEHVLFARDRIGKPPLGHRGRQRQARRDRLVGAAERLIETAEKSIAESRRKRCTRTLDEISHTLEAGARQRRGDLRLDAQRRHSQRQDRRFRFTTRHHRWRAIARHAPGAAHAVGDGNPRLETLMRQPRDEIAAHRRFAAEQMRAAANVEHQPVRRIETGERRIAVGPVGDRFEQAPVGFRIGLRHCDAGMHRAHVGKRHAGLEPKSRRRIVHRGEPQRRLDWSGDDARRFIRCGQAAFDPVGREPSQPHRQVSPVGRHGHDDPR